MPGVTFDVSSADGRHHASLAPGVPTTLPASGPYALSVSTDHDGATPYTLTMTIR
jgi:hypothetical protein